MREHYENELGVIYVIYSQHIWSVERGGEGWRGMSDRGSTTPNHYDHVHVSVSEVSPVAPVKPTVVTHRTLERVPARPCQGHKSWPRQRVPLLRSPPMDLYSDADRERYVAEPPKRVAAPERTPFERDRARVDHAAASRAARGQDPGGRPSVRRLRAQPADPSLEVAQVARDLSRALGVTPTSSRRLRSPTTSAIRRSGTTASSARRGQRGLRRFRRQRPDVPAADPARGRRPSETAAPWGYLTRATLDACTKYPWSTAEAEGRRARARRRLTRVVRKFGVYDDDRPIFAGCALASRGGRVACRPR